MKLPKDFKIEVGVRELKIFDDGRHDDNRTGLSLEKSHFDHLSKNGPFDKYHDYVLIPNTMDNPLSLFEGLKRTNFDECRCYCSKPLNRIKVSTVQGELLPAPKGFVFCVYVRHTPDGFSVLDWAWRKEDKNKQGYPDNWSEDFVREIPVRTFTKPEGN